MSFWSRIVFFALLAPLICGGVTDVYAQKVAASIVPLQVWAREIGGEPVAVVVDATQNPALFEPTARQLAELSRCELLFVIGVPAEYTVLPRLRRMNPSIDAIDLSVGLVEVSATERAHSGHHDHGALDPHPWTSPSAAVVIIERIGEALAERSADPAGVRERALALAGRWRALHEEIGARLDPLRGRSFLVYHPAFGHFAQTYGLEQIAVEAEGVEPGARHLAGLIERVRGEELTHLFFEPQFSPERAKALARAMGVEPVQINPLARDLESELRRFSELLAGLPTGEDTP